MGIGTYLSTGLSTASLGVLGSREPEVRSFIVHGDGTKSEEPAFKEATQYRSDQMWGLAFGLYGAGLAIWGVESLRNFGAATRHASTFLSALQGVFGSSAGQAGLRAASIGLIGLGGVALAGHGLIALGEPIPGLGVLTDRFKSSTVLQVYYDESGQFLGTEAVPRAFYEQEREQAEDSLGIVDF